jgi:glutamate formiminotransferase/formiminotetrahydrofolate cyclodeaminase
MPQALVECIPNFSEARRPEVVAAIQAAIGAIPGIRLLDQHSDLDHNRTVLTFVGPPEAVEEAAFQAVATAASLINLDEHRGEHPRIGATDVVPFVPISGVSMQECVEMARRLGRRVGETLGIPVYLYEEAATRPERQNLENLRRGQYEALKVEMGARPERDPDFGPARVGPAGATVIGARHPLIAYNIYLTTDDVAIAKQIAKAVRQSSGGLRYVKGLGLLVEGRAQVSMNLTNFRATPLARVVELVRREAARHGVAIHHSELVGLIPQEALVDAAVWYTQLDQFTPDQILESRLYASAAPPAAAPGPDFLAALASADPTPGGGSAAAYSGAMAAALVAMMGRLTVGRRKYAAVEQEMQAVIEAAEGLRASLQRAAEQDAAAYQAVMAAYKLPKDSPEQDLHRQAAIQAAMLGAARVPLAVSHQIIQVLELAARAAALGNLNALTDIGTGAELAQAALKGASLNVRVNASSLADQAQAAALLDELQVLEDRAAILGERVHTAIQDRGGPALA